jgi:hypothetical protein
VKVNINEQPVIEIDLGEKKIDDKNLQLFSGWIYKLSNGENNWRQY